MRRCECGSHMCDHEPNCWSCGAPDYVRTSENACGHCGETDPTGDDPLDDAIIDADPGDEDDSFERKTGAFIRAVARFKNIPIDCLLGRAS